MRELTEDELRNSGSETIRSLGRGESVVVTRDGVAVEEPTPLPRRQFVAAEDAVAAFAHTPRIDATGFREDVDAVLDQDPSPVA